MARTRSGKYLASAATFAITAVVLAACSSGQASTATTPVSTSGPTRTVDVATSSLGQILVDSQGNTLYLFQKDMGTQSECTGECANSWPPLLTSGKPTAGSGADASLLGTTARSDGGDQVTYDGHPLYRFSGDQQPGDTNGEGLTAFGASWFVLSPAGAQVSGQGATSGGGAGY
jgi:predicted lipoprotein with Yx(FWY)xxD motif